MQSKLLNGAHEAPTRVTIDHFSLWHKYFFQYLKITYYNLISDNAFRSD